MEHNLKVTLFMHSSFKGQCLFFPQRYTLGFLRVPLLGFFNFFIILYSVFLYYLFFYCSDLIYHHLFIYLTNVYWYLLCANHRASWDTETQGHRLEFSISFPPLFYHQDLEQGLYNMLSVGMCEWRNESSWSSMNWTPNTRDKSKSIKTCCDMYCNRYVRVLWTYKKGVQDYTSQPKTNCHKIKNRQLIIFNHNSIPVEYLLTLSNSSSDGYH